MKKIIKNILINEGRYDSLTRKIVKDIFKIIVDKSIIDVEQAIEFILPYGEDDYYTHDSGISFNVILVLNKTESLEPDSYHVNTFVSYDDELVVEVSVNPDINSGSIYEELFYKINEDIRHEIEHYTQKVFKDKQQPKQDTATYSTTYEHHMDPSEVEALAHGFYRKAKLQKKHFDTVVWDDLNKDISTGKLNKEEAEDIFNSIVKYARRRLPKATYSTTIK